MQDQEHKRDPSMRDHCVSVRMNVAELAQLDAVRGRRQRGAYLRDAWLGRIPPEVPEISRTAVRALGIVGNNINQIARRINQGQAPDLELLHREITALRSALVHAL